MRFCSKFTHGPNDSNSEQLRMNSSTLDYEHDMATELIQNNNDESSTTAEETGDGDNDEGQVTNRNESISSVFCKTEDMTSLMSGSTASELSNITEVMSDEDVSKSTLDKSNKNGQNNTGFSMWVTNLLPNMRAQELMDLLSPFGKVICAKVVQSLCSERRCYGYVLMEQRTAVDLCIEKLSNTKLKGQTIHVAKVRPDHSLPMNKKKNSNWMKKYPPKQVKSNSVDDKTPPGDKSRTNSSRSNNYKKKDNTTKKENAIYADRESLNHSTSTRRDRTSLKSTERRPDRKTDILSYNKIRVENIRKWQRERTDRLEKLLQNLRKSREIKEHQRIEAMRLKREKEKLRIEREQLDRQHKENMQLVRERERLVLEELEKAKQALRRKRLADSSDKRTSTSDYRRKSESSSEHRKRPAKEHHYGKTRPMSRFDMSSRYNEYVSEQSSDPYWIRGDDREWRSVPDHQPKSHIRSSSDSRYVYNARGTVTDVCKDDARVVSNETWYRDNVNQWHSNTTPVMKPYTEMSGMEHSSRDNWNKTNNWWPMKNSNYRWTNSSYRMITSNAHKTPSTMNDASYSNMTKMDAGMSCPPPKNSNYSVV